MTKSAQLDDNHPHTAERKWKIRWQLMFYDIVIYLCVVAFMVRTYGTKANTVSEMLVLVAVTLFCLLLCRVLGGVYNMIIRYGGVHVYMRLFATDSVALLFYFPLKYLCGLHNLESQNWLLIILLNLLGAVGIRLMYRYCYRFGVRKNKRGENLHYG